MSKKLVKRVAELEFQVANLTQAVEKLVDQIEYLDSCVGMVTHRIRRLEVYQTQDLDTQELSE